MYQEYRKKIHGYGPKITIYFNIIVHCVVQWKANWVNPIKYLHYTQLDEIDVLCVFEQPTVLIDSFFVHRRAIFVSEHSMLQRYKQ